MKEIDVSKLFKLFISHIVPIVLAGILCAALAFGYCSLIVNPVYRTSTSILVNNGGLAESYENSNTISSATMSASLYLVTTCVDILTSDNIYKELSSALGGKYDYTQLRPIFSVSDRSENSLFIDISVTGYSPKEIMHIANTFLEIVPTYIKNTLSPADVKIMANAEKVAQIEPRTTSTVLAAFLAGMVICFLVFLVIDLMKNTIENEADFKERYDIPLLGAVPVFENKTSGGKRYGNAE